MQQELPLIKDRIPEIKKGPFYKGVTELDDHSVNINIVAQCTENDRLQLIRDLNREMKLLFDKYGIKLTSQQADNDSEE